MKWNELHPGIQAATSVGRSSGPVLSCRICREPDHSAAQYAWSYTQPQGSAQGGDYTDWQSGSLQPPQRLRRNPWQELALHGTVAGVLFLGHASLGTSVLHATKPTGQGTAQQLQRCQISSRQD